MPVFRFDKLVRGKLPERYKELNQKTVTRRLIGKELLLQLRNKLVEEVEEIPVETDDRRAIIREMSDVEQAMIDMRSLLGIDEVEIEAARIEKLDQKGGFTEGIFVEQIELEDGDPWIDYYRKEPHKYSEGKEGEVRRVSRGVYRHSKTGKLYEVIGTALQTETEETMVVYRPLYASEYELFARPHDMFIEIVEISGEMRPRFEKVEDE